MDSSMIIAAGVATFFNFIILKWKFTNNRVADGVLDAIVLGIILFVTAGSLSGMIIGMIGSSLFSLYLLWSPFDLSVFDEPANSKAP